MKLTMILLLSLIFLSACEQKATPEKLASENPQAGSSLVTVNGQPITDVDLSVTTKKLFSRSPASLVFSADIKNKALESMVMMMVIAQAGERQASEQQLEEVDAKVRRYREELLTEIYLRQHGNVAPPTQIEIANYYENNKALFGEKPLQHIAIVRAKTRVSGAELQQTLQRIQSLRDRSDWSTVATDLQFEDSAVEYLTATTDIPQLDKTLLRVADALEEGEVSNIAYIDNKPHIVKLLKTTTKRASPLETVSDRIRKTLAAKKLRQQIKSLSDELLTTAEVVYVDANQEQDMQKK
jgi:hypothetical protein